MLSLVVSPRIEVGRHTTVSLETTAVGRRQLGIARCFAWSFLPDGGGATAPPAVFPHDRISGAALILDVLFRCFASSLLPVEGRTILICCLDALLRCYGHR